MADSHIDKKTQANEDSNETVVAEAAVNPEPAQTSAAKEQASDTSSRAKSAASKAVRATTGTAKKAASRVADGVKSAAVSAAKNAKEAGDHHADQPVLEPDDPTSVREVLKTSWLSYYAGHHNTMLYGILGLIVGICMLIFGFWSVLLVLVIMGIGVTYGQYRDGDPRIVNFIQRYFGDQ